MDKNDTAPDETPDATTESKDIVDEIAADEGDELLKVEDEKLAAAFEDKKLNRWQRFKQGWSDWWHDPKKRRLTLTAGFAVIAIMFIVPMSRYFVLNLAGVRSSASVIVLDDSTQQPLRNVSVEIGDKTVLTDQDGRARFQKLRLGRQDLVVHKRAFADLRRAVTIGWGSNPLGDVKITPTGSQYTFEVSDYLSGKSLEKVEAANEDFNAQSNEKGIIKLTIDDTAESGTVDVVLSLAGYRQETVALDLNTEGVTKLAMVPDQKHVFVSKRSGRFDIYKIDADGQNETKILSGSGTERDDLVLAPHPSNGYVALVSTRENVRNKSGFLLSTLTLIEPESNIPSKIAQSERIQIVDWIQDRLIFVQVTEGASAVTPNRHRLMSYDLESGKTIEIAAANFFNDVISISGSILYAPSATYSNESPGFYKVSGDGSSKQTIHNEEVWNVFRTDYDKLVISSGSSWYEHIIGGKLTKLSGEPPNLVSRIYVESPNTEKSLWVDDRDGKGVLLALQVAKKEDKVIHERSGLQNPVRWLNDSAVVFRVVTSQETADYVMSLDGGEPRKLKDVTDTTGVDRWYYY